MSENKCPFCGSKKIFLETPFIDPITKEHGKTFCCSAQKKNHEYIKKRYSPFDVNKPSVEDISKL